MQTRGMQSQREEVRCAGHELRAELCEVRCEVRSRGAMRGRVRGGGQRNNERNSTRAQRDTAPFAPPRLAGRLFFRPV